MLTLAQAFSDAFNEIGDKYIMEAIEYRRHKTKHIQLKWVVLAAALLIVLTVTTMAAIRFFGLRDLVLDPVQNPVQTYYPNSETVQTDPERPALPDNEHTQTSPTPARGTLSLSGYMNTPESQALAEWHAFLEQYDSDHSILNSVGNYIDENLRDYVGYLIYTQEMENELERIADKYGLKLHTDRYDLFAHPELLAPCEGYLGLNRGSATYMFEDGTFHVDGGMASIPDFGIVDFQLARNVRGSLHDVTLTLIDINDYQEWDYKTACGVPVVLALGPGRALILADLDDSFVTVLGLVGANSGLTEAHLEELADSFDFTKLDPVVVPELADVPDDTQPVGTPASERTTARETYAAVLRELLYCDIFPDGTPADPLEWVDLSQNRFAVLDVTGDGQEDLILLYTTTYTAGMRGMVVSFDGTYTGIARPVSIRLDEYPMLTFYDNGYIKAEAYRNQTWGELWPYTLYNSSGWNSVVADVSSLDKHIMESVGKGDEYPEHYDINGAGTLYRLSVPYGSELRNGTYYWDAAEYEAWLERTLGNELAVPYLSLTEENIAWMESQ